MLVSQKSKGDVLKKVKFAGSEEDLRELVVVVLAAIDRGEAEVEIDGVKIRVELE